MIDIRIIDMKENKVVYADADGEDVEKILQILKIKESDWVKCLNQKELKHA